MPKTKADSSPVIVLGMHRSGTSCLSGCLQEAGLYLGQVNEAAPANAKGNRENRAIMELHEDLLAGNGASWDAPRAGLRWTNEQAARRRALIAEYPAGRIWGFKDPRTLLALEGWLQDLPAARLAGSFRHPAAVARSLAVRNGFEPARSLQIWAAYNRALLQACARHGVLLVDFDLDPATYLSRVRAVARQLGLPGADRDIRFFETGLRRQAGTGGGQIALPEEVRELHLALRRAASC